MSAAKPWRNAFLEELRALAQPGPRMLDEAECVGSVLLAILFAHLGSATNIYWAAFSGYAVMRTRFTASLMRGIFRIGGTILGGTVALFIVPIIYHSVTVSVVASAVIGGITLYGALTRHSSYAWLFVGITFEITLFDRLEHPSSAISQYVYSRVLEVASGTVACVLVSWLGALTLRRLWPEEASPPDQHIADWQPKAARHALQGACALMFLPVLWHAFAIPQLAQGAVTIMTSMLVPLTPMNVGDLTTIRRRVRQRLAGCLCGATVAGLVVVAARGTVPVLIAATIAGIVVGRHIETSKSQITYAGRQFTMGILIVLVPNSYAVVEVRPAVQRVIGILIGMGVLELVLLAFRHAAPKTLLEHRTW